MRLLLNKLIWVRMALMLAVVFSTVATDLAEAAKKEKIIHIGDGLPYSADLAQSRMSTPPLAEVMCALIRENRDFRSGCSVMPLAKNTAWWDALQTGKIPFAVVRSDQQHQVWETKAKSSPTVSRVLRALFALETQPVAILVPDGSGIETIEELQTVKSNHLLVGNDLDQKTLRQIASLFLGQGATFEEKSSLRDAMNDLCIEQDPKTAVWVVSTFPNNWVKEQLSDPCNARLISFSEVDIKKVRAQFPFVDYATISVENYSSYAKRERMITTAGLATTVVSSRNVSDILVNRLLAAIFDNFFRLQSLYLPAVALDPSSSPDRILRSFRTAPLHEGAWRYYLQRGWITEPYWVVLGSFRDFSRAVQLASLLAKTYPDVFKDGFQVRLAVNNYFGVIAGEAVTNNEGNRIIREMQDKVPAIKDAYIYPAFGSDWSPELLRLNPRIYMHIARNEDRDAAKRVKVLLGKKGWKVPGIERVVKSSPSSSKLRYFKKSESLVAQKILQDVRRSGYEVTLQYIRGYENSTRIRPLHFELWFAAGMPSNVK